VQTWVLSGDGQVPDHSLKSCFTDDAAAAAAAACFQVSQHPDIILDNATIKKLIGDKCDGVIGQLTEVGVRHVSGIGQHASFCMCRRINKDDLCSHALPEALSKEKGWFLLC
jgi:hypothetical protein